MEVYVLLERTVSISEPALQQSKQLCERLTVVIGPNTQSSVYANSHDKFILLLRGKHFLVKPYVLELGGMCVDKHQ